MTRSGTRALESGRPVLVRGLRGSDGDRQRDSSRNLRRPRCAHRIFDRDRRTSHQTAVTPQHGLRDTPRLREGPLTCRLRTSCATGGYRRGHVGHTQACRDVPRARARRAKARDRGNPLPVAGAGLALVPRGGRSEGEPDGAHATARDPRVAGPDGEPGHVPGHRPGKACIFRVIPQADVELSSRNVRSRGGTCEPGLPAPDRGIASRR